MVIDADQLAAESDLHLLARRACSRGHRVEGILAGDVMVGMDLGRPPVGHLVGLCGPLTECVTLLLLEDYQRQLAGRAMDPLSGYVQTPPLGRRPHIRKARELPALVEPLPDIEHSALSRGCRTRAGSEMKLRCWAYSRKPRVRRGWSGSAPATAEGKLSMTRYLGTPPKKAQAASSPSITSASFWLNVGQTKL